ncbi:MAG: hypothetical protein EAX91_16710 [Candidatus Lokiarchaeota archaeon]|nr:hypothetical protein [Candidatus Lokiarchaeota archaeon]
MEREELKAILDTIIPINYHLFEIEKDNKLSIKEIVENEGYEFKYGRAYYQLTISEKKKGEVISLKKKIIAIDKHKKKAFIDEEARVLVGTPDTVISAKKPFVPAQNIMKNYLIFIQSKSWKRVPKKCFLIYLTTIDDD